MKLLVNNDKVIKNIAKEIEDRGDRWYVVEDTELPGIEVMKEYHSIDIKGVETVDYMIVKEVSNVPEYVETEKYCYDELNGFYENPNYVEPREMEE